MGLFETEAAKALASSAVFLFMTVLLIAAAKRISTCIVMFSAQSVVLVLQVLAVAHMRHSKEAYAVAGLVLIVKAAAIPYALFRIVDALKAPHDVSASTTSSQSVFIAAGLILLSFFAVQPYAGVLGVDEAMLAALATTFGMPLVIEIGVVFDLLMGVFLMGLFVFRIRDTFEHLDVSKLRRLRG